MAYYSKAGASSLPNSLKEQVLNQLHTNHMGIEKQSYWPRNVCTGLA